ncbi:MAG: AAA family ATPase [Candidatus Bipolaricaulia bacterium]
MIESAEFRNFKVLQDTTLLLGRFTLIVGPNNSGKSTALRALQTFHNPRAFAFHEIVTAGLQDEEYVEVVLHWGAPYEGVISRARWVPNENRQSVHERPGSSLSDRDKQALNVFLRRIRAYSLIATTLAAPVRLEPKVGLSEGGHNLVGVLDHLRDHEPERFEALNEEFGRWLPEFDRILFDTPETGRRVFLLRTREGQHPIQAADLSQGTLLALAVLTLAYLPDPPSMVCLEEPDRGIHPRLRRNVQDALYRLSYPENFGEKRDPVQVVATTHSPYFLDLYKDHPEEIVIAEKIGLYAQFERLIDRPDIEEILEGAPLGEVWYSGVLGGVPREQ